MKKELFLMIYFLILTVTYFCMLFFFESIRQNWFSYALLFLSLYMFLKAYFFRSDSSLFGAVLAFLAMILFHNDFSLWQNNFQFGTTFSIAISFAFFVDFLFFQSKFTFYSFLPNFLLSFPIFLYAFNCINLVLMISLLCGAVLVVILLILANKYGKI